MEDKQKFLKEIGEKLKDRVLFPAALERLKNTKFIMKKKIVILTGAGISAESGIKTFRDMDGLWYEHKVEDVASIGGWNKNKKLVLDFYNERRKGLSEVWPNSAHIALAELEKEFDVTIITQNVDDLHERAGSTKVIHLHGELNKMCSSRNKDLTLPYDRDIQVGDKHEDGSQLRPFIVWFGEAVPKMEEACSITYNADIFVIIGTSLEVYPAASLIDYTNSKAELYYIDKDPKIEGSGLGCETKSSIHTIAASATVGVPMFIEFLKNNHGQEVQS